MGQFDGKRWRFDLNDWAPANPNPGLVLRSANGRPNGIWVSSWPGSVRILARPPKDGGGIRIRVTEAAPNIVFNGRSPRRSGPLSLKADIRVPIAREVVATIYDIVDTSGRTRSARLGFTAPAGQWVTVILRANRTAIPAAGDNYSVGIRDAVPGDDFDLRNVSVYKVVLP